MTSLGAKQHFGKSATRTLPSPAAAEAFLEASGDPAPCVSKPLPLDPAVAVAVVLRGPARMWPGNLTAFAGRGSAPRWEHVASGRSSSFRRPDRRNPSHVYPATSGIRSLLAAPDCMAWMVTTTTPDQIARGRGLFSLVWQVLGSNQRRLSRRFYSQSILPEVHAADQRIRRSRHDPGLRPSAMRPWASSFGPRTGAEKPTDGGGGSGYADRPPGFSPLTWHFRMPARCRRLLRRRVQARAGRRGCRGRR
jgi:hypothetical protein